MDIEYKSIYMNELITNKILVINQWLTSNHIGSTQEKRYFIAKDLFWVIYENNISDTDIQTMQSMLLAKPFVIGSGNLWSAICNYFYAVEPQVLSVEPQVLSVEPQVLVKFWKDVAELTPCGLNTSPNACCGKYELLWRLLRPYSRQPKRGDIEDGEEIYELKGCDVRICDTEIRGVEYSKKCKEIFHGKINGNAVKTGGLKGSVVYEIEKTQHRAHYEQEFAKIGSENTIALLQTYMDSHGWNCNAASFMREDGTWNQSAMQKCILKNMFIKYKLKTGFTKMVIFGDGTNVKIIFSPDDLDNVQIVSDYFRINQEANVGYYIQ